MRLFLQFVVSGITAGVIYSLVGLGWGVVYRVTGILNLAQGAFLVLGAVTSAALRDRYDLPFLLAVGCGVAAALVAALLVELLAVRMVAGRSMLASVLITFGCALFIEELVRRLFGNDPYKSPPLMEGRPIELPFGATLPVRMLPVWILAVALFVAYFALTRTVVGRSMRACAEDPAGARYIGIPTAKMSTLAWVIAGLVGGIGGALLVTVVPMSFSSGFGMGLKGFVALAIVGMSKPLGALVGGLVLGISETLIAGYVSSEYRDVIAYAAILVIFLLRPDGLFDGLPGAISRLVGRRPTILAARCNHRPAGVRS